MTNDSRVMVRISDVAEIVTGSTPSSTFSDNWGGEVPFLTPSDMSDVEFWPRTSRSLSDRAAAKLATRLISKPSVAVVCIGATIGKVARISRPTITNQQINTIVPDPNRLDPLYCFYALQTMHEDLKRIASGSATPLLNKSRFGEVTLELPPVEEQRRIAKVLGSLDELIELNLRLARESSDLCEKLWDKAFSGITETVKVIDVANVVLGGTPSRARSNYWGGDIPWLNSSKANEFRVLEATETITSEGLNSSSTKMMPIGTTIIAITGSTLGQISRLEVAACGNQSLVGVFADKIDVNDFLYFALRNRVEVLMRSATGGAQQHVNKADVENLELPKPVPRNLEAWHETAGPLMRGTADLLFEAEQLKRAKSFLLDRLICGDLLASEVAA